MFAYPEAFLRVAPSSKTEDPSVDTKMEDFFQEAHESTGGNPRPRVPEVYWVQVYGMIHQVFAQEERHGGALWGLGGRQSSK
jgi:hypothetical protein